MVLLVWSPALELYSPGISCSPVKAVQSLLPHPVIPYTAMEYNVAQNTMAHVWLHVYSYCVCVCVFYCVSQWLLYELARDMHKYTWCSEEMIVLSPVTQGTRVATRCIHIFLRSSLFCCLWERCYFGIQQCTHSIMHISFIWGCRFWLITVFQNC